MKLYSGPLSLFSRKVEIALAEKRLAYERVMVAFTQQAGYTPKHPAVLAANPKAQVPVFIDGELILFDSTLIMEYLQDAYPEPPLFPAAPAAKARCRQLELFADEIMLPPLRSLMARTEPPAADPERRHVQQTEATRAETTIQVFYATLEQSLAGQSYFCGNLSVADIALFMSILFVLRLRGPTLDAHPALARWYANLGARPAFATVAAEIAAADRALSQPVAGPTP